MLTNVPTQFWRVNVLHRDQRRHLPQVALSTLQATFTAAATKVAPAYCAAATARTSIPLWRRRPRSLLTRGGVRGDDGLVGIVQDEWWARVRLRWRCTRRLHRLCVWEIDTRWWLAGSALGQAVGRAFWLSKHFWPTRSRVLWDWARQRWWRGPWHVVFHSARKVRLL